MQTVVPAYHRDTQRGENRDRPRWGPSAAIVQQIMEAHGGVVESKNNSTPGRDLALGSSRIPPRVSYGWRVDGP